MENGEGYSWVRVNCKIDPAASKPKGSILLMLGILGILAVYIGYEMLQVWDEMLQV